MDYQKGSQSLSIRHTKIGNEAMIPYHDTVPMSKLPDMAQIHHHSIVKVIRESVAFELQLRIANPLQSRGTRRKQSRTWTKCA